MAVQYELHQGRDGKSGQMEVFSDPARFRVLVAGRRWGKTWLAVTFLIAEALTAYDRKVWYVAPWYRQAKDVAWKMLKKMLPESLVDKTNETELTVSLVNGSEISLKGADNPDSLLGVGLHAVVLDEYASMKSDVWQEIIRPMLTDTLGKALFIGTPKGKNHFWDIFTLGLKGSRGYKSFQYRTVDSPMIPESEVESAKEQLNEKFYRQEYEASFEDFTGLVYPEFSEKTHVIHTPPDLAGLSSVVGIDPALSGVHAWLLTYITNDGTVFVIKEYYEKDKRVSEVASTLPKSNLYIIDPAGYNKSYVRDGNLYAMADEYREYGIYVNPGENDVDSGINRVGELFKRNKIIIHARCKNLIWELNRYHWSEHRETVRGESKPRPYKKDDHLCDILRYIVMSRYKTMRSQEEVKPHKMSVEFELQKMLRDEKDWKTKWTPVHN